MSSDVQKSSVLLHVGTYRLDDIIKSADMNQRGDLNNIGVAIQCYIYHQLVQQQNEFDYDTKLYYYFNQMPAFR